MLKILLKPVEGKSPRLPEYRTPGASGADLFACLEKPMNLAPGETKAIPTGFIIAIPDGFEGQVRPRSGLAMKYDIGIINSPGTIDSDYRGEVKILLTNFGNETFIVRNGDRIAQLVITPVIKGEFIFTAELSSTERGEGGFGHTGN